MQDALRVQENADDRAIVIDCQRQGGYGSWIGNGCERAVLQNVTVAAVCPDHVSRTG